MGKVLNHFKNGFPGAVSRSADDIILSLRNASGSPIPFGTPVFFAPGENACKLFDQSTSTSANFIGIAVRIADKTPDTYGGNVGQYAPNDPVDILVRGNTVLSFESTAAVGAGVYVRKADGKIVTSAGGEGTTVQLPGVTVRTGRDTNRCAEVSVTKRNFF